MEDIEDVVDCNILDGFNSEEPISYNEVPQALMWIIRKLSELEALLKEGPGTPSKPKQWMNAKDLSEYLPNHPSVQTIYGWTASFSIPFHKKGKKTLFLNTEIDEWMAGDFIATDKEMEFKALAFVQAKKRIIK